jgi:hypothetical protein
MPRPTATPTGTVAPPGSIGSGKFAGRRLGACFGRDAGAPACESTTAGAARLTTAPDGAGSTPAAGSTLPTCTPFGDAPTAAPEDAPGDDGAGFEGVGFEGAGFEGAGFEGAGFEGAGLVAGGLVAGGLAGAGLAGGGAAGALVGGVVGGDVGVVVTVVPAQSEP